MEYIVIYNPELRIIGPFKTAEDASAWGSEWQSRNDDNPCWNAIEIKCEMNGKVVVEVERPLNEAA